MVTNIADAPQVEAISTTEGFLGSWWPAFVLGSSNGNALVRYQGYKPEDDEWLPLSELRLATKMLERCSDVVVGKVYEVFGSSLDWRDAEVLQVHCNKCMENNDCNECTVTVRYATNAGVWAGVKDTIGPVLEKVTVIPEDFEIQVNKPLLSTSSRNAPVSETFDEADEGSATPPLHGTMSQVNVNRLVRTCSSESVIVVEDGSESGYVPTENEGSDINNTPPKRQKIGDI